MSTAGTQPERIGRASELGTVEQFLVSSQDGRALVLSGEPGIGKSVLWEAGVELARSHGFVTLCARASETEAQLSFAGLADLLEAVDSDVLAELPAPQRHALEVAVRRVEPVGPPPEEFAIAAALLAVLRLLSSNEPVLVAIDDVQWLDGASAAPLLFAARRVNKIEVRFLASRRRGRSSELETVLGPDGVLLLEVGPLSFGAISHLLSDRLGQALPRRVVRQLFETSGGNPLFALEMGRAVIERGVPELGASLPVPTMLAELFGARVEGLAPDVRRALLAVALSAGLTADELAAVVDTLAIEDARMSGVVTFDGPHARPAHPLLASAVSSESNARERRELHLALAAAVKDDVLRARHLALAATGSDMELAHEVSTASHRAAARGAVQDAAELARHALRLTPPADGDYDERLLELARYFVRVGEHERATELLADRIDQLEPGATRAAAHLLLGEAGDLATDDEHLVHAIAESVADPALHAEALARRAGMLATTHVRRLDEAERLATDAMKAARSAGAEAESKALPALAWARILRGHAIDDLIERAADLPPAGGSLYGSSMDRVAAVRMAFRGELPQAREIFRRLLADAEERGEMPSGAVFAIQACEVELRAGSTATAEAALDVLDQWAQGDWGTGVARTRALATVAALRGEPAQANALATEVAAAGGSEAPTWDRLEASRVLGVAALLEHDLEAAVGHLDHVWAHTRREGVDDPGAFPVAGDLVEALTAAGQLEAAREVIARLGDLAREQQHPWGLATLKRAAAAATLADGYDDAAVAQLAEAAAEYRALGLRFESARTMLLLGRIERRFKKRAAARESLTQARLNFEQLGCTGWADAAGAELERISGRRAAAAGGLTPSEQRVADLVASGLSNKEVAAQLFISVYTVEAHLSKVYAKLGVRSRTQLAQQFGASSKS